MALNFEIEKLIKELKKRKPKKILVQLPEGVKKNALNIFKQIENLDIEVVFSGETCWGGCSVAVDEAKNVGADLIVHFGHAPFMKIKFPIIYLEIKDELNLSPLLKKSLGNLKKFKKIGLSCAIQHKQDLEKIKNFYEKNGKEILISEKKGFVAYEGQIIGCEYSGFKKISDKVDCFVVIGNKFHSMGAVLAVNKPVFLIDVYNDKIEEMSEIRKKILKQRAIAIDKFKSASKIGIIVETKLGQKFGSLNLIKKELKNSGKNFIVIIMNEITPDKLMNFYDLDCFVELGCPRIAIDDFAKYEKSLLTLREALVGLGKKTWKEFLKEGVL